MRQLSLHNPLLDQLVEGIKIEKLVALRVALILYWVVLKDCDSCLELLIEQSQQLLLPEDLLAVENHLLPLAIRLRMLFLHLLSHLI